MLFVSLLRAFPASQTGSAVASNDFKAGDHGDGGNVAAIASGCGNADPAIAAMEIHDAVKQRGPGGVPDDDSAHFSAIPSCRESLASIARIEIRFTGKSRVERHSAIDSAGRTTES